MNRPVSYEDLNPVSFLERSALVHPDKPALIYDKTTFTYGEFRARTKRLAAALQKAGVRKGDRVAILAPNVPPTVDSKFGPMRLGAILVALNIRLASKEIAYILNHSGAKALLFDSEFAPTVRGFQNDVPSVETYVQILDAAPHAEDLPGPDYESFLSNAPEDIDPVEPLSEFDSISINYTSGTTGFPKGVEYQAWGAYLNAIGEIVETGLLVSCHRGS